MTRRLPIIFAAVLAIAIAVAVYGQVPPCINGVAATTCNGARTVQMTDLTPQQSGLLSQALAIALTTPGIKPAASTGCLTGVTVSLCRGLDGTGPPTTVACPLTPDVVSIVSSILGLPATQPVTLPATQPATAPTTAPDTVILPTQPTSAPATAPVVPVVPAPPVGPIRAGVPYAVDAGETLHVDSTVTDAAGSLKCRTWSLFGQVQTGYNAAWWVPETTTPEKYILQEWDAWTVVNEVDHVLTVNKDPYTTVAVLPSGGNLLAAAAGAKNLTRIVLPAGASYTVTGRAFVAQRLQIVTGGPGVTVKFAPAIAANLQTWPAFYFLWSDASTAQLTVTGINFTGPMPMRLDSVGKTGLTIAYCPFGTVTVVNCSFRNLDQGVQLDSRPTYQCIGSLFKGCTANDGTMCGCPIWGAGRDMVVEGCSLGPSREEHPLRLSIVDLKTNQVPRFVRVGNSNLVAVKQSTLTKEALAARDVDYFCADGVKVNNWIGVGQGVVSPWDVCQHLMFNNITDTFDTIHLRMGVTGPVTVQNSVFQVPPVVGVRAGVAVTMTGNK